MSISSPGAQRHFKHIAESVQPQNAFLRRARKRINEKARAAQQHVRRAVHPR